MVKAIIFDWHGVLDKNKFDDFTDKISEIRAVSKESIKNVLWSYGNDYTTGKISSEDFWSEIEIKFSLAQSELRDLRFYMTIISLNYDLWSMLPELKTKYKLAVLSDCPKEKAGIIRKNANLSLFDAVTFSSEIGLSKDSIHFFNNMITKLDLPIGECLYVDDREENILFASKIGFKTCLYKTPNDIKSFLKEKPSWLL